MREALGRGLAANEGFWNSISTEFHLTAPESEKFSESEKSEKFPNNQKSHVWLQSLIFVPILPYRICIKFSDFKIFH